MSAMHDETADTPIRDRRRPGTQLPSRADGQRTEADKCAQSALSVDHAPETVHM